MRHRAASSDEVKGRGDGEALAAPILDAIAGAIDGFGELGRAAAVVRAAIAQALITDVRAFEDKINRLAALYDRKR